MLKVNIIRETLHHDGDLHIQFCRRHTINLTFVISDDLSTLFNSLPGHSDQSILQTPQPNIQNLSYPDSKRFLCFSPDFLSSTSADIEALDFLHVFLSIGTSLTFDKLVHFVPGFQQLSFRGAEYQFVSRELVHPVVGEAGVESPPIILQQVSHGGDFLPREFSPDHVP